MSVRAWSPVRLLAVTLLALATAACGGSTTPTSPSTPTASAPFSQTDLRVGAGSEVSAGRTAVVHYTLWLFDPNQAENKGRQIQSSRDPGGSAFSFPVGAGRVIRGWDQGVPGMRVGGLRRLVIPPELAYGAAGSPPAIPGNATLVFEVELLDVL